MVQPLVPNAGLAAAFLEWVVDQAGDCDRKRRL
jgi:hypothetical protein